MVKKTESAKNPNSDKRIALFGGTFDPVHCAHLKIAHCALEQAGLDRVIFVPAAQSPLKNESPSADALRLQMLQLALQGETRFEVSRYEIEQGKVSYTIDTVDHFRQLWRSATLFFIIGEDQLKLIDKWYRVRELVQKVFFLVYPRDNSKPAVADTVEGLRYSKLDAEVMAISSTKVRDCCNKGLPLTGLVPHSVEVFIHQQGLYKSKQ